MELRSVEAVVSALNRASVRYLIVGGVAVNAHGFVRYTKDLDLVIDLEPENCQRALGALSVLGYAPSVPVPIASFADPAIRRAWVEEKNMVVFQLVSDAHRRTPIDVFVRSPFNFERAFAEAHRDEIGPEIVASFCSYPDLVALKRAAARPQDLVDLDQLAIARDEEAADG